MSQEEMEEIAQLVEDCARPLFVVSTLHVIIDALLEDER